jgi:hypothetical protein
MGTEHPQRNKAGSVREKSLRLDAPADEALLLLEENALEEDDPSFWADEPSRDVQSLLEENARLRGLLVEISGLIRRKVVDQR